MAAGGVGLLRPGGLASSGVPCRELLSCRFHCAVAVPLWHRVASRIIGAHRMHGKLPTPVAPILPMLFFACFLPPVAGWLLGRFGRGGCGRGGGGCCDNLIKCFTRGYDSNLTGCCGLLWQPMLGYYGLAGGTATACPAGSYCAGGIPTTCPINTNSAPLASSLSDCTVQGHP